MCFTGTASCLLVPKLEEHMSTITSISNPKNMCPSVMLTGHNLLEHCCDNKGIHPGSRIVAASNSFMLFDHRLVLAMNLS